MIPQDKEAPEYRRVNLAIPCCCGSRAPNTMDLDSFHMSGTFWRERAEDGLPYRDYMDRARFSQVVVGEKGVVAAGECWEINCLTIHGGCGRNLSGDSQQETIDLWNKRGPLEGHVSLTIHNRLKRRVEKRDKIIEGLKARIRQLESSRHRDTVGLGVVEKAMSKAVQSAMANLRFFPVLGLGADTKVATITLENEHKIKAPEPARGTSDQN